MLTGKRIVSPGGVGAVFESPPCSGEEVSVTKVEEMRREDPRDALLPPRVREMYVRLVSRRSEEGPLFPGVLSEYMREAGIESVEELHRRYVEARGYLDLQRFQDHLRGEDEYIYTTLIPPLSQAFRLAPGGDAQRALVAAYAEGYAPPFPKERSA